MPRLPAAEDYGVSTPRPSRVVTQVGADPIGRVIQGFGGELSKLAEEEARKVDELSVQNALNDLDNKELELTYGERGYSSKVGNAVLSEPILKTFPDEYKRSADSIAAGLKSNRAREAFMLHASKNGNRFSARVMEHVAQQTEKAREQSITARIATAQNLASTDPTRINESLGKIRIALAEEIKRQGLTPEKHKDEIAVMETAAMGQAVLGAFNTLAGKEDFEGAKALLEDRDTKRWLGDKTDEVDRTLKHMEVKALATPLGQKAFDARNAGLSSADAIKLIQDEAKGNMALAKAAEGAYRDLRMARREDNDEVKGSLYQAFWDNPTRGVMQKTLASREFNSLPEIEQAEVQRTMIKELEHQDALARSRRAEDSAQARMARAEANERYANDPAVFSAYLSAAYDPRLGSYTDNQMAALLPVLGKQNVMRLMSASKEMKRQGLNYRIATPAVEAAMAHITDKTEKKVAQGMIEMNLDAWKQANPGQVPTPQQEELIIKNSLRTYVQPVTYWGVLKGSEDIPAYKLGDAESKFRLTPRGEIPALVVPKSIPEAAVREILSVQPNATTAQVTAAWEKQQAKKR